MLDDNYLNRTIQRQDIQNRAVKSTVYANRGIKNLAVFSEKQ